MSGRPSWADSEGKGPRNPTAHAFRTDERAPLALVVAAVGVVVLAAAEAVYVAGRDDLRPAMRVVLVAGIALQVPCAALALRRSPTAAMALLLCGITAVVAGLAGAAIGLAVVGATVVVLVARSLRWFPEAHPWSS